MFVGKRTDILERKEEILQWISENKSKADIAKLLNCDRNTLNRYLKQMDIEYAGSTIKGQKKFYVGTNKYIPLKEYCETSSYPYSTLIMKKLLREEYKEYKCENCGLIEWMGLPIPLELHHIDGDRDNNTIENFQLLCPNCHALTPNYRGKNRKKK